MERYRSTPPVDDTYRRLPNGSYNNLTPAERDRYRNTPPLDGADPYRDIPAMDDDRYDPNRPPSERGDAYQDPSDQRFNIPPRDDDPYQDARPIEASRYGGPLLDDARPQRTPSPAGGSDRMGKSGNLETHHSQPGVSMFFTWKVLMKSANLLHASW